MTKKKEDYRKKETKELTEVLKSREKNLLDADISFAQGKAKDVHKSRKIRLDIARIKTLLSLKKLEDR